MLGPPYVIGDSAHTIRFSERARRGRHPNQVGRSGRKPYDNALAETINGQYKTELIKPVRSIEDVELPRAGLEPTIAASTSTVATSAGRTRGCLRQRQIESLRTTGAVHS